MHTPPPTPSDRAPSQLRALIRLAMVALRRTAFENSAQLLAAVAAVVLLADGARRIDVPQALDRWLIAALVVTVVLPVAMTSNDPLRSSRLALLPVPRGVLHRATVIASAPLRLPLAILLLITASVPIYRVASSAAVLTLIGWSVAALFAGAALEARWYRPRAIAVRAVAAALAMLGTWCLWSLRGTSHPASAVAPISWIPALLPRGNSATDWLIAFSALFASAALGVVVLRTPSGRVGSAVTRARSGQVLPRVMRLPLFNASSFPRFVRPAVAHDIALLMRHVGSRAALALVAVLSCAAVYGRVPGLALVAITPMTMLTANMLGADVSLGGIVRHRLQPVSLADIRDRRLTVWGVCTALVAMLGTAAGSALPAPASVGTPTGGLVSAPAMLLFAVTLVPWFGRASWWWARRYPQPLAQRVNDVGTAVVSGPTGPAHVALGLLAAWTGVALLAALLWGAASNVVRVLMTSLAVHTPPATIDAMTWIGAAMLTASVAGGAHVALGTISPRAARTRTRIGAEADR